MLRFSLDGCGGADGGGDRASISSPSARKIKRGNCSQTNTMSWNAGGFLAATVLALMILLLAYSGDVTKRYEWVLIALAGSLIGTIVLQFMLQLFDGETGCEPTFA